MEVEQDATQGSAFVDVISNTLMVVLLLTLILAITGAAVRVSGATRTEPPRDAPGVRQSERELFPPWSRYYVVHGGMLAELDLAEVARNLASDHPGLDAGGEGVQIAQGRFKWLDERRNYAARVELGLPLGDVNVYRLELWPELGGRSDSASPGADGSDQSLIDLWKAEADGRRSVPGFFVYPSGMDRFATLFQSLQEAGLAFRWTALKDGEPVVLYRSASQFTSPRMRY